MTLLVNDRLLDGASTDGASLAGTAFVGRGALSVPAGITAPTWRTGGRLNAPYLESPSGSGATVCLVEEASASSTTKYAQRLGRFPTAPTVAGLIGTLRGSSDVLRLGVTASGKFQLFGNQGGSYVSLGTSTPSVPVGSWFRYVRSVVGTVGTAKIFFDPTSTTPDVTLTGTVTSAAMTIERDGNINGANLNGGVFQVAWPQVSNDAEPGVYDDSLYGIVSFNPASVSKPGSLVAQIAAMGSSGSFVYEVLNWGDGISPVTSAQQSSPTLTRSIGTAVANGASKVFSGRITAA